VSFISFATLGTNKVLSLAVFDHIEPINSNWGVSFHSILVTITQLEICFKTKVSHKHMVIIYHWNTPLPKVRKGLDRYTFTSQVVWTYYSRKVSTEETSLEEERSKCTFRRPITIRVVNWSINAHYIYAIEVSTLNSCREVTRYLSLYSAIHI
jgi:hypothetical protein